MLFPTGARLPTRHGYAHCGLQMVVVVVEVVVVEVVVVVVTRARPW